MFSFVNIMFKSKANIIDMFFHDSELSRRIKSKLNTRLLFTSIIINQDA